MTHPYTRLFPDKSVAPTVSDDSSLGYEQGDIWIDAVANKSYQCFSSAVGVAVWIEITGGGSGGYTQEQIEDFVGAMFSGNTESGIDATYDDAGGKINLDSQTAGDARYAPIAKGVTGGDLHDHAGGDGNPIDYSSLTGTPTIPDTEAIQDIIGGMVTGNTELGVDLSYDDTTGKLNADAQTAGDIRYAPIAKGVTNGDSHDHLGGDGGTIAYGSLSGTPTIPDTEAIQDIVGDMMTGNLEFGISVTYDDSVGKIDFSVDTSAWRQTGYALTRVSNFVFTTSGDVTSVYRKYSKIRWQESGGAYKYGVVQSSTYSVPTSTVTLIANADYVMAASALSTENWVSYINNPEGYPHIFNFTPTFSAGVTVGNATVTAKWSVVGNMMKGNVLFRFPAAGATCAITGQITVLPPVAPLTMIDTYGVVGGSSCVDWANALYMGVTVDNGGGFELRVINAAGTYANWIAPSASIPFTWGVLDTFTMEFAYLF